MEFTAELASKPRAHHCTEQKPWVDIGSGSSSHFFHFYSQQSSGDSQPGLPAFFIPGEESAIQNPITGDCTEHKRLPAGQEWKHTPGGFSGQGLYRRHHQLAG